MENVLNIFSVLLLFATKEISSYLTEKRKYSVSNIYLFIYLFIYYLFFIFIFFYFFFLFWFRGMRDWKYLI